MEKSSLEYNDFLKKATKILNKIDIINYQYEEMLIPVQMNLKPYDLSEGLFYDNSTRNESVVIFRYIKKNIEGFPYWQLMGIL